MNCLDSKKNKKILKKVTYILTIGVLYTDTRKEKGMAVDIEEYYTKYGPMVLRRCRFLLRDEDKALDAMQDVFVKVLLYKEKLKDDYPSNLLYRIATNVCLNIIRSEKRKSVPDDEDFINNIASFDDTEEKVIVHETIDEIFKDEKQSTREIAVMHYVDGMTLQQVADAVGLSMSGVRKRLRNLKAKVKNLKDMNDEKL